jgi:hypothetical protein
MFTTLAHIAHYHSACATMLRFIAVAYQQPATPLATALCHDYSFQWHLLMKLQGRRHDFIITSYWFHTRLKFHRSAIFKQYSPCRIPLSSWWINGYQYFFDMIAINIDIMMLDDLPPMVSYRSNTSRPSLLILCSPLYFSGSQRMPALQICLLNTYRLQHRYVVRLRSATPHGPHTWAVSIISHTRHSPLQSNRVLLMLVPLISVSTTTTIHMSSHSRIAIARQSSTGSIRRFQRAVPTGL